MASELKHLLDFDALKDWGFIWGQHVDGVVVSYFCLEPNPYHHAKSCVWLHDRHDGTWEMYYALPRSIGRDTSVIFRGPIPDNKYLELMLETTLIAKP